MPVPIQPILSPIFDHAGVQVFVKRDDLLHPIISGNKAYKLKYNLLRAKEIGAQYVLTFGGAYSNHLHATAYAARAAGLSSIGLIRGEQILPLNPTLRDCVKWGMTLHPLTRKQYQTKESDQFKADFAELYPNSFWIPEGGANGLGVKGAQDIINEVDCMAFDYLVAACGTGTTLAGLIRAASQPLQIIGVPVLKGANWMYQDIEQWLADEDKPVQWTLWLDYHFGGYAKTNTLLQQFIAEAQTQWSLPLDRVYTAKALFGLVDQIKQGYFAKGSRILFCHTGGLQGMRASEG